MLRQLPEEARPCSSETGLSHAIAHAARSYFSDLSLTQIASQVPHQSLNSALARKFGIDVRVRRDDLIHPLLSGNKLYKLFGHVRHWAQTHPNSVLCSFGGAYSNHLHALAGFGQLASVKTVGIIRGEPPRKPNATLQQLEAMGMTLVFVSRKEYEQKSSIAIEARLEKQLAPVGECFWIPEGGASARGMEGCITLGRELAKQSFDYVLQACGTGTTFLGLAQGLAQGKASNTALIGVSALRNSFEITRKIASDSQAQAQAQLHLLKSWSINNQYHFGGFAKTKQKLQRFMLDFEQEAQIPVEKVYTGKLFFALISMIKNKQIGKGSRVLVLHSGGLQNRENALPQTGNG